MSGLVDYYQWYGVRERVGGEGWSVEWHDTVCIYNNSMRRKRGKIDEGKSPPEGRLSARRSASTLVPPTNVTTPNL